ncbi:MAG: GNAT family N-acetyltransferase [Lachnospira sp.]
MKGKNEKMNREIYATDGEYTLLPISDDDRKNYIELHRQINGEHTLFLNPYCKDMMWEQVLKGKDKVFSIFNRNGDYCGSIEIQRPESDTPEIGIDLLENKRNKGIAPKVVVMLAKRAYQDKTVEYYLIRISSRNPHSKHVFEKMGAIPIRTTESSFNTFMKSFEKIMGNTDAGDDVQDKFRKYFDECKDSEEEVVYEYKFIPELFL